MPRFGARGPREGLNRRGFLALAGAVVHVHELFRAGEISDNVKFSDGFSFGGREGGLRGGEFDAFVGFFCPTAIGGQIFQGLRVFDEDVHGLGFTRYPGNAIKTTTYYCVSKIL